MDNFVILAIILSVILVTAIILKVLHNNDDTFDTLLRRRTERERVEKTRKELYKLYKDKILDSDIAENKDNIRKADITEYKYNIEDFGHKNYNKEKTSHVTGYWKKTGVSWYRRINNDFNENSEYNELLKTAEWKRRREDVFIARGRRCMYCGNGDNLDIHHKYYFKYPDGEFVKPWEYNMDCYMVLCRDCHNRVHDKYRIKSYYIRRS